MFANLAEFRQWLADCRAGSHYVVERAPLERLRGWHFTSGSGDLVHESGKFFSVRGLRVETDHREVTSWSQPIIEQPEIGILGIIVRIVDGVVHCLMQAKMEPGNINLLQISPTVQATRSNYTQVHRGKAVPYLEHFVEPREGRVIYDALQSEQGSWFFRKRNRNMIVEVSQDLPLLPGFCWLSLEQIQDLLKWDNLVNMDSRTVLAGAPFILAGPGPQDSGVFAVGGERREAQYRSTEQILSWFTEMKSRHSLISRLVPLTEVPSWHRDEFTISHDSGRFFSIIGVDVTASDREVRGWSQPMIEPCGRGVIGFLCRRIRGEMHLLVHARTEAGTRDVVEMSPTVNCVPANFADVPAAQRPRYLDEVLAAASEGSLVDVVHSEEGGRFFAAENRYIVTEVGEEFDLRTPDDYCWMTPGQLLGLVRYGNHVNVAARCLLACLSGAFRPGPALSELVV